MFNAIYLYRLRARLALIGTMPDEYADNKGWRYRIIARSDDRLVTRAHKPTRTQQSVMCTLCKGKKHSDENEACVDARVRWLEADGCLYSLEEGRVGVPMDGTWRAVRSNMRPTHVSSDRVTGTVEFERIA